MQKGHRLEFSCIECEQSVTFSILQSKGSTKSIVCENCQKKYSFGNSPLWDKLKKFEALCRQIHESEEILGDTAVAIDVSGHRVKVPYRLLLTRLNSILDLKIGEKAVEITFRIEPLNDVPEALKVEEGATR
jgi:transcription elongation factor Elf1